MAIDRKRKVLFYHVAKTGGTSIEKYFGWDNEMEGVGGWIVCGDPKTFHIQQSMTPEELVKYGLFDKNDFDKYFNFCITRNPWDRLVSAYSESNCGYDDFNNFVIDFICPIVEKQNIGEDAIEGKYLSQRYRPTYHYLYYKNIKVIDYIGKFENFLLSLKDICNTINEPFIEENIPHLKKKEHLHYRDMYNDEAKKSVEELYKKDIEMFNYEF